MFRSVALFAASAQATKLLVVDNSKITGPDRNTSLVEIDLEAQSSREVTSDLPGFYDFVRGSIACGNTWYGIGSALPQNFLAVVDLASGDVQKVWPLQGLYYDLKCTETDGELLAVTSTGSPPVFSLTKLTLQQSDISAYPLTEEIGQLPEGVLWGGWPSIFHFSDNELQATFPRKNGPMDTQVTSGQIIRMDIKTGEVTMNKNIKGTPGVPMYIKHTGGESTSVGLFAEHEGEAHAKLCHVDFSGKEIKVSKCGKQDMRFWDIGKSPVQCGSDPLYYWPSVGAQDDKAHMPIFGLDFDSGEITTKYNIDFGDADAHYVAHHTCSPSASTVAV